MSWLPQLFRRRTLYNNLREELRAHLEEATEHFIRDEGMSREEAEQAARRAFGNATLLEERSREIWQWPTLESIWADLRYALRQLRRSPGFTITALLTLTLVIGANTAIFSLAYALLLRSLPIQRPDQLVMLQLRSSNQPPWPYLSGDIYKAMKDRQSVFTGMCDWSNYWFNGEQNGDGRNIWTAQITGDCFGTLGLHAELGRLLAPADDEPDTQSVVISDAWWQMRFHRDPSVLGRKIVFMTPFSELRPAIIIGVLPPSFRGIQTGWTPSVFIPRNPQHGDSHIHSDSYINDFLFARLRDGVTAKQAAAQLDPLYRSWNATLSPKERPGILNDMQNLHLSLVPARTGFSELGGTYRKPLFLLQSLVGLLLLAGCVYLGTLFSSRSIARGREIALRAALGASCRRLIRQLLSESLLLALSGAIGGVLLAILAGRFLLTFVQSGDGPSAVSLAPDRNVLLFTLAVTIVAVLLCGLLPALHASRVALQSGIKAQQTSLLSGAGRRQFGWWMVPTQTALSLLIVVIAGLLSSTLVRLLHQDNGYKLSGSVFLHADFPWIHGKNRDDEAAQQRARMETIHTILDRLNHTPGIQSASLDLMHALSGGFYSNVYMTSPSATPDYDHGQTNSNNVGPRYFETIGSRMLAGREFDEADTPNAQPVCILDRAAARAWFPNQNALGHTLYKPHGKAAPTALRVVGIVDDIRDLDLRSPSSGVVYVDAFQDDAQHASEFVLRSDNLPAAAASFRGILAQVTPGIHVITHEVTMQDQVARSLRRERLVATLANSFAALALLLSAIGLYGVLSYSVSCRVPEIGVRMAIGASRSSIVRLIVTQAARLVIPGILFGAVLCLFTTRLLRSQLYQTSPGDPLILILAPAVLCLIAIVAAFLPARRAAAIDPMQALRSE
jgi:predicted permease